ncbi:hypothetical protein CJ030_MR3G018295 [Morella rubra]|uniref:Uncharacterized protein n=1 Tax=Morella rubra TaxID=262757 RepID=A0A6A1W547_9ROSI|nr:hypothetical protein CJ030_MR3G018295 [Morella rubra]
MTSLQVLDLSSCTRLHLSVEEYLEQLFVGETVTKFSKLFAIPEYGSNTCPVLGIEMMSDDSIGAIYIGYGGKLYCVRNLGDESDYFLQPESQLVCSSMLGSGLSSSINISSTDSCITLKIHGDSDDNCKREWGPLIQPKYCPRILCRSSVHGHGCDLVHYVLCSLLERFVSLHHLWDSPSKDVESGSFGGRGEAGHGCVNSVFFPKTHPDGL